MDIKLAKVNFEDMETIKVDKETLKILEHLIGIDECFYDWWALSQGLKDIVMGLYLLKGKK